MIKNTNNMSLTLSLNILKALGGDTSIQYDTVDDVWNAINEIYDRTGDGFDIESIILDITENGQYNFNPNDEVDAFAPVHLTVNVPQKYTDEQVELLTNTARQEGFVSGKATQKAKLIDIEITDNGVYETENGYKKVTVAVEQGIFDDELQQMLQEAMDEGYQDGYAEGVDDGYEDGATEQKAKLTSVTFNENGTYTREDGWNRVTIAVEGGSVGKPKVYNGFRFTGGDISTIDFSQYDWSNVYDTSNFFYNCTNSTHDWTNFIDNFNGKVMSCKYMFSTSGTAGVYELPNLGTLTEGCVNMSYMCNGASNLTDTSNLQYWKTSDVITTDNMFYNCSKLTTVPLFDTSKVISMNSMFYNCSNLTTIPLFDTSKVISMNSMFYNCSNLTTIPLFDTSNVTNMSSMFEFCSNITTVPLFNTSNVTSMGYMFTNCSNLTTVPLFDTSNVTSMGYMFNKCYNITTVPLFNTSNVTSMGGMFTNCSNLTTVPLFDTSNVTGMESMFDQCINLTSIPLFNTSNVAYISYMFRNCKALTDVGGFRNLGAKSSLSGTTSFFISDTPNLTKQSLLNIFNELYNRTSAGYSVVTIKLHANHLALLTDEDKAIATNKGWALS